MKLEDILEKVVTLATIIFIGWHGYNRFFKKDDTPIQQQQGQYNLDDYRKQQAENKKAKEECLQIVGDYLKRYGYNVTYLCTTNVQLTNWKYNVTGTITNPNGTTRGFGVLYDYPTKTIIRFDVD